MKNKFIPILELKDVNNRTKLCVEIVEVSPEQIKKNIES